MDGQPVQVCLPGHVLPELASPVEVAGHLALVPESGSLLRPAARRRQSFQVASHSRPLFSPSPFQPTKVPGRTVYLAQFAFLRP